MKKELPLELEALLKYFPLINPPLTLSEEVTHKFSSENKPLPQKLIDEIFARWDSLDEFAEIVPCCQLKSEGPYYSIIYWKGSLMAYEYILATIDEAGILISKRVIAGTISNGITVKTSVASIDENGIVYSMVGEGTDPKKYNPENSKGFAFEILPDGTIDSSAL